MKRNGKLAEKVKIIHFHNGTGGGVLSVIRNLLLYKQHAEIENHIIYTINQDQIRNFTSPGLMGSASEQVFYYSPKWNFYYTCKQLAKLLPDDKAVIIAHDWLELGMISHLGMKNPVVQVLHGDFEYYYNLAKLHCENVDKFICVSKVIAEKLKEILPAYSDNIQSMRFPVPDVITNGPDFGDIHCAYFVRDLTEERKQFHLLPLINQLLIKRGVEVKWFLAGAGMDETSVKKAFGGDHRTIYYSGHLDTNGINEMLAGCNVMILPSLKEGFPVAVVEAMKWGLVPLVTNWEGATEDLIIENQTGFLFKPGDVEGYAEKIAFLFNDRQVLKKMSEAAKDKANDLFNPQQNTLAYENSFMSAASCIKRNIVKKKVYGSRLDQIWLPNMYVKFLRLLKNRFLK